MNAEPVMTPLTVHMFPCLADNYGYLVHDPDQNVTAVVDTPDAGAIEQALADTGWTLNYILNTHHHWDHAGGNLQLKKNTGCTVVGPKAEAGKIPGIDIEAGEGDEFMLGDHRALIYDTPGHTLGHIVYHFVDDHLAFVGDTLFSLGCGRVFEGTPDQMWNSLVKLRDRLSDDTLIYCAHEYTQANARFALTVEPDNPALQARAREVDQLRAEGRPTIPARMDSEKAANPFLRADVPALLTATGLQGLPPAQVFAEIRQRKDRF